VSLRVRPRCRNRASPPDGVRVVLMVRYRAEIAREALNETARKGQVLEALFTERSIGTDRWVTTGIGLQERSHWQEASARRFVTDIWATVGSW